MLSRFGMTFLFFLAGLEIDFEAIRGRPIAWAGLGWLVSVGIAMAAGWGLQAAGVIVSGVVVATGRPMPAIRLLKRKLHTSAQLPIRVSLLVLAALVILTKQFGLDSLLGAIAAGVVVSLACRGHEGEAVRHKLEAIGFGFFIPMFFIATGMKFDLHALTATPAALLRVPLFLGMFLLARGVWTPATISTNPAACG